MPGMGATLREFKKGKLHSGSKHGPVVKSRAQALAIGESELRDAKKKGGRGRGFTAREQADALRQED